MHKRQEKSKPRILVVTPEITYLPEGMGNMGNILRAKAGGLADVSASLVGATYMSRFRTTGECFTSMWVNSSATSCGFT